MPVLCPTVHRADICTNSATITSVNKENDKSKPFQGNYTLSRKGEVWHM